MASVRSIQVKLVDMGSAQRVSKLGSIITGVGEPEYSGIYYGFFLKKIISINYILSGDSIWICLFSSRNSE